MNENVEKRQKDKKQLQIRLRKVQGQIKGIEKMIENDTCCKDVLIQVAAARAAINKVGSLVLKNYASSCLSGALESQESEEKLEDLVKTLSMFLK